MEEKANVAETTPSVETAQPATPAVAPKSLDPKMLIIGGVGLLVVVGGLVLVWALFLARPSPKRICNHMRTLVEEYMKDELDMSRAEIRSAMRDEYDLEDCIENLEEEREDVKGNSRDTKDLKDMEKCVLKAKDFEDVEDCLDEYGYK